MSQNPTIEQVDAEDARIAAEHEALREHFYADDSIWQHENCGLECDGRDH